MNLGAILIGIAGLVLITVALADPWARGGAMSLVQRTEKGKGEDRKATLYALRDLDFDYQTGKLTQLDYESLRAKLLVEAASDLEASDALMQNAEERLEEAVLARRMKSAGRRTCPGCGVTIDREHHFCYACGASLAKICSNCGSTFKEQDAFCTSCGEPILASVEERA